ncbi:MAG TPA: choice-of-anchor tandem repeat GloVer-containing protein [Terriglobales bacterium]|nr:choice-of-anchor tandem repeat GloVer-containing protein [Terriglobales bacterium]
MQRNRLAILAVTLILAAGARAASSEKVLFDFTLGSDGAYPTGGLVFDAKGNLYGTTESGGANLYGTVFQLTHSKSGWTENVLYSFTNGSDGAYPYGRAGL